MRFDEISQREALCSKQNKRKILLAVIVLHIVLLGSPLILMLWTPQPPPIETKITVRMMAPNALDAKSAKISDQNTVRKEDVSPKPEPPKKVEPVKKPDPPKTPKKPDPPKPPKKTIEPKKPVEQKKTVEQKKPTPPKPPKKPVTVKDIKISKEVTRIDAPVSTKNPTIVKVPPTRVVRDKPDLTKIISGNAVVGPVTSDGANSRNPTYDDTLTAFLSQNWDAPSNAELGTTDVKAVMTFTVNANGKISSSRFIKRSGISVYDQSLQDLFKTVQTVPTATGVKYPYEMTITFVPQR